MILDSTISFYWIVVERLVTTIRQTRLEKMFAQKKLNTKFSICSNRYNA